MKPVLRQDLAYLLRSQPYRDNSLLVQCLTESQGKVSFIVNGLKSKRFNKRSLLQPCRPIVIHYLLKDRLSRIKSIEESPNPPQCPNIDYFMLYQYAHELLLTILPEHLPTPDIFTDYQRFLQLLSAQRPHLALRHMELAIIHHFQGLPDIPSDHDDSTCYFHAEHGFLSAPAIAGSIGLNCRQLTTCQRVIAAYLSQQLISEDEAAQTKVFFTHLMQPLLNGKALKTKAVYHDLMRYLEPKAAS